MDGVHNDIRSPTFVSFAEVIHFNFSGTLTPDIQLTQPTFRNLGYTCAQSVFIHIFISPVKQHSIRNKGEKKRLIMQPMSAQSRDREHSTT